MRYFLFILAIMLCSGNLRVEYHTTDHGLLTKPMSYYIYSPASDTIAGAFVEVIGTDSIVVRHTPLWLVRQRVLRSDSSFFYRPAYYFTRKGNTLRLDAVRGFVQSNDK